MPSINLKFFRRHFPETALTCSSISEPLPLKKAPHHLGAGPALIPGFGVAKHPFVLQPILPQRPQHPVQVVVHGEMVALVVTAFPFPGLQGNQGNEPFFKINVFPAKPEDLIDPAQRVDRNAGYPAPPAQICTCEITAHGSYFE